MTLAAFHFLRPEWLLAALPALLLCALLWRRLRAAAGSWERVVDAHLLRHLAIADDGAGRRWPLLALGLAWLLAAVAMAGPTWEKLPTPALDRVDPTVVVLSLAQSMNATDQSPTRLAAARYKIDDLLGRLKGGQVGLVIYADSPFVASPLTEDGKVVAQMLPDLATSLMPVLNDRLDLAIAKASELLKNAGASTGRIVVLSSGLGEQPAEAVAQAQAAARAGYHVAVIGLGTAAGTSLLDFNGGTVRAADGSPATTKLDQPGLARLAAAGEGPYTPLTADDHDLGVVLSTSYGALADRALKETGLVADQWRDMGPWLVLALLLVAPLAFRRGWIATVALATLLSTSLPAPEARAQDGAPAAAPPSETTWTDLWRRRDQQGSDAFARGQFGAAAATFEDPRWQASALYRNGSFKEAADAYGRVADGDYNRGNALARAGELEEALKAYDAALQRTPDDADAKYNRDLVQKLLDQRNKQQQQDNKSSGGQDQSKSDQSKSDQDKSDQRKPDPNKSGQSDQAKQDQDKQDPPPKQEPPKQEPPKQDPPKPPEPPKKPDDPSKRTPQPDKGDAKPPEPPPAAPPQDKASAPPPKPDPAQPQPAAAPPQPAQQAPGEQDGSQQAARGKGSLSEQDQNREQALRMVPNDLTSLLRARIMMHYGQLGLSTSRR